MKKVKITLAPSESVVFSAAAHVYASYIAAGRVQEGEEQSWMERAMKESIKLAIMVDQAIQSDSELD